MNRILLALIFLVVGWSAQAERITILSNERVRGAEVIRIKRKVTNYLRNQGMDPEDYVLTKVEMRAKGKRHVNSSATLIVGDDSERKRVPRALNPFFWDINGNASYHELRWDLSGSEGTMEERWTMRLRGDMKVKRLYVHVSPRVQKQRIRIPLHDERFQGLNSINLKQELRRMGYRPKRLKLERVVLIAKSRKGRGEAELIAGWDNEFPIKTIRRSQDGESFQSNRRSSYNRIRWNVHGRTRGPWEINLKGRIKVKAIVVQARRKSYNNHH